MATSSSTLPSEAQEAIYGLEDEEVPAELDYSDSSKQPQSRTPTDRVRNLKLEDARKRVENWVHHSKSLRLILTGKVGAGKSTLVNCLLRMKEAEVGSSLTAVTKSVSSYKGNVHDVSLPQLKLSIRNIDVQIWDTPGLEDPNEEQAMYGIESIKQAWSTSEISLMIYCIDMTRTRSDVGDKNSIKLLTEELGVDIWSRTVVALTRANLVKVKRSAPEGTTLRDEFERKWHQWQVMVKEEYLIKGGVPKEVADHIPFIPCGYKGCPLNVLTQPNWSVTFWKICLARMLFESIPAFLVIHSSNSVDGRLSEDYAKVITQRMTKPTDSDALSVQSSVQSLVKDLAPVEVTRLISEVMMATVQKRNSKVAAMFVLGACLSALSIGIAG